MAAELEQVLDRTELAKLSRTAQDTLEKFVSDRQSEINDLKHQYKQLQEDSGNYANICVGLYSFSHAASNVLS